MMLVRVTGDISLTVLLTWDHRKAVLCWKRATEGSMYSDRKDKSQILTTIFTRPTAASFVFFPDRACRVLLHRALPGLL